MPRGRRIGNISGVLLIKGREDYSTFFCLIFFHQKCRNVLPFSRETWCFLYPKVEWENFHKAALHILL